MMVMSEKLQAIVDRIYESVERPELWPDTIRSIGECIGGGRHFWGVDENTLGAPTHIEVHCRATFFLSRADLEELDRYEQEFGDLIVRFLKIIFLSILWSQSDVGTREVVGLRLARRYLGRFEPSLESSTTAPSRPMRRRLLAALWEDGSAFDSDSVRSMRLLVPHLDRALRLQMRLSAADFRVNLVSGALDSLTIGVILVDRSGLPLWINKRAQEIIKRSNALQISSAGLIAMRASDTRSLRELIKGAVSTGMQDILALSRDADDLRPLLLIASPLKPVGTPEALDEVPCAVVFISDPDRTDTPPVESLRRAFNLTNREAQMAIALRMVTACKRLPT